MSPNLFAELKRRDLAFRKLLRDLRRDGCPDPMGALYPRDYHRPVNLIHV